MRPYDLTKFRKEQNKKLKIKDGFFDPLTWVSTGNFALNKMMSGNFYHGIPIGSVTTFGGESGSGKSFLVSGNIIKNALEMGIGVILIDTEGAVKKTWAKALGVDTDNEAIIRWSKRTINEVAMTISDFMEDDYKPTQLALPREEQQPILFVIDSLGNLETETGLKQFTEGDMKGDKGIFAKQLKALMKNTMGIIDGFQVGVVCTNHTYKSQDMYSPDDIITGGSGPIFLSDIVVSMNKYKLKEDEDGNKVTTVQGIRSKVKCVKSRYARPFEEVEIHIPYETGMDAYSGLFDMFEKKVFRREGNSYVYFSKEQNKEIKLTKKKMDNAFFDMVMREWDDSVIIDDKPTEIE